MSTWVKKFTKPVGEGTTITMNTSSLGDWAFRKPSNYYPWNGDTTGKATSYTIEPEKFNYVLYLIDSRVPSQETITGGNMVIHKDNGTESVQTIGDTSYNEITTNNCSGCYVVIPKMGGLRDDVAILVASTTNANYRVSAFGESIAVPYRGIWFAKRKTTNDYVCGLSW